MKSYATLKTQVTASGLMTVTIHRPEVRNAFNHQMIADLTDLFAPKGRAMRPEVKVIVLQGEGKAFCAGGDLNWMKASVDFSAQENLEDTRKLTRMFAQMNEFPKPMIAAIHGAVIGGGVGLASVVDMAIAVEDTVFSLAEVRLGLIPACIGPFVISKIGAGHARHLFMSAERFNGRKAYEVGLVHQLVRNQEELHRAVAELAGKVLMCGPEALARAKELVLHLSWPEKREKLPDCLEYVAKMLADLRVTEEGQEGVRAFLEKRQPKWLNKE